MHKLKYIAGCLAVAACASLALAGGRYIVLEARIGTNTNATVTKARPVSGYVDEIYIIMPAAVTNAQISVVARQGAVTNGAAPVTVLYTNALLTANAKARPRVTQTDNAGNNLSTLTVAERFFGAGDPVTLSVKQAGGTTNQTVRALLKVSD